MYSETSYDDYVLYKIILSVIFKYDETILEDYAWIYGIDGLSCFKTAIEVLDKLNALGSNIKENIFRYLNDIRFIDDEYKKERITIINDIINFLHTKEDYIPIEFYRKELYKRRLDRNYLYVDSYIIRQEFDEVNESIGMDSDVLISHSLEVSDEEFIKHFLPYLCNNELYDESLNALLNEYPKIFTDKLFYDRMISVLNFRYEFYKDEKINKENNKFIKIINKKIKEYK